MLQVIIEMLKFTGLMLGASIGLNLILRPKLKIPQLTRKEIQILPLTVLIEELLFREGYWFLLTFFLEDPTLIFLGVSIPTFTFAHLSNLKKVKHSSWDIPKYILVIGILGAILGYLFLTYGFWFTFGAHLMYDIFAVIITEIAIRYERRKKRHGRYS